MNPINNRHNIKSLLFDIIFDDERRATELYDDIRRIHYQELEEVISRCLDQFAGVDAFASLDEIELDLGPIHYRDLNTQFAKKVHDSLTEKIKDLLKGTKTKKGIHFSSSNNTIDLIKHYLLEGYLPWNTQENIVDLFKKSFQENTSDLIELLKDIGKSERVRQRIVSRFDTPIVFKIIQALSPSNSQLIRQFHHKFYRGITMHTSLNIAEGKLEKELWLFILNYLLVNPLREDQRIRLVKNVLVQFSEKFRFPFFRLVTLLANEIQYSKGEDSLGLNNILTDISKVLNLRSFDKVNLKKEFSYLQFDEKTEFLFKFLLDKDTTANIEDIRHRDLQQHLMQLLQTSGSPIVDALKDSRKTPVLIKRMIKSFGLRPIYALVRRMEPGSFKTIVNYHQNFIKFHQKDPITAVTEKAFSHSLWEIILQLLVNRSGTYFNQIVFLKSVITQLSYHYNIDYYELIERLQQTALLVTIKSSRIPVFIKLLCEIYDKKESSEKEPDLVEQNESSLLHDSKPKRIVDLSMKKEQGQSYYSKQHTINLIEDYFIKKESTLSLSFIRKILIELLEEEPELIFKVIKEQSNNFSIIKRLIFDFDEELIQKMVKAFEPKNYRSVINYQKNTLLVHKKQQLIQTSSIELSDALWNIILKILLSRSSSRFNKRSFLKKLLIQTAAHYNVQYHALIDQLFSAINTKNIIGSEESSYRMFVQLIREIKMEKNIAKEKNSETKNKKDKELQSSKELQQIDSSDITTGVSRISESLMKLILIAPTQNQEMFTERGFASAQEAIQYLILYQKETLIQALKKASLTQLNNFIKHLPGEAMEILIHSFKSNVALSIQDFLTRLNRRLYDFGIQQREYLMQKIRAKSTVFLLQDSTTFPLSFLNDLELIIDHYNLPNEFFIDNQPWKIPVSGSLDNNLRELEEKLSREIDGQLLAKSKTALLLEAMLASSRQKYSKISYKKKKEIPLEQEIFISNAGLVILNGYLYFFFDQCGYLDESGSMKPELAKRAALLLQYLFDPEGNYSEELLVLNKILCGLAVNEILPAEFEANDLEKDIISKMLDAIISHWKMISNSTHEGFRESWLQRKGKLTKKEKHWELHVEKSAFDILLDYKPFTLSPVKFDWMKKIIKVNWR